MTEFNRLKFLEGSAGIAAAATLGTGATVWTPAAHARCCTNPKRAPSCACCTGAASCRATLMPT